MKGGKGGRAPLRFRGGVAAVATYLVPRLTALVQGRLANPRPYSPRHGNKMLCGDAVVIFPYYCSSIAASVFFRSNVAIRHFALPQLIPRERYREPLQDRYICVRAVGR
jgi:hypothetical protein